MKNYVFILFLLLAGRGFAQETVQRESKIAPNIRQTYNVLKTDYTVQQGTYAAYYRKQLVAAGKYDHNVPTGTWNFFNPNGLLLQRYDYTAQKMAYEAPEDSTSIFRYNMDKPLDSTAADIRITKPVRLGGRYFGYIHYLNLFKLPQDLVGLNQNLYQIYIELLVSPGGRLAEYKVHIQSKLDPMENQVFDMNIKLLSDEDKRFIPASYNNEPVSATIMIICQLYGNRIEFYNQPT